MVAFWVQERVEELAGTTFNSCLLNFYRSGLDHMGYHSDNERLYGSQPIIGMPFGGQTGLCACCPCDVLVPVKGGVSFLRLLV